MKSIMTYLLIIAAMGLSSCEREGPAEKAGRKVDNAAENAKDKFDEATEDLDDDLDDDDANY